ncbi:MAG: hypothetical protein ACTSU4_05325 [Promethearchaeota archaeon]
MGVRWGGYFLIAPEMMLSLPLPEFPTTKKRIPGKSLNLIHRFYQVHVI